MDLSTAIARDAGGPLLERIALDYQSGRLQIPSLPEIALRVRAATLKPKIDFNRLARIIRIDPALAARLIQVANSPLFRGSARVRSIRNAVVRLGLTITRQLVTSLAMRHALKTQTERGRRLLQAAWCQGINVAAISYVLARITRRLDPERALLAGLIHDIGRLPIVAYVDNYPELSPGEDDLESALDRYRSELGVVVLRKWEFDDELVEIPIESGNWFREGREQADYADVVLLARIHEAMSSNRGHTLPRLIDLPAFKKFPIKNLGPGGSLEVLHEAREEIQEIMEMLQ